MNLSNSTELSASKTSASQRLVSLDALRGFDMLWIIGFGEVIGQFIKTFPVRAHSQLAEPLQIVSEQLEHVPWEGLHFEDLIFPLFVFIVGVSVVFSLSKSLGQKNRVRLIARIISRSCLLYLLGLMVYHGFDQPIHAFAGQTSKAHAIRWMGVLQRIAICYCVTASLFCVLRLRYLVLIAVIFLVGYWLVMAYVSVPGVGRGSFIEGRNLCDYIDQQYLGGYKYGGADHDAEGLLSNIPAVASCLLGVFAGSLLKEARFKPYSKVGILLFGGIALAGIGYAWGFVHSPVQFPVIKKLWTSSFVLLAGGYSAMLLGLFYLVMDIWKLRMWALPFVWIGTNAITLYMLTELHFIHQTAVLLVGGTSRDDYATFGRQYQGCITLSAALILTLALARFLYRRGVFIRV
jgi:predicted acyltransferase